MNTHSETPKHFCAAMLSTASVDKQFQGMNASLVTHPPIQEEGLWFLNVELNDSVPNQVED